MYIFLLNKRFKPVPEYLHRQNFIPKSLEDFGDGGAFPEIHVVQYPLNMGRPGAKSTAVITVDVDKNGQVRYDAIVKQGANRNKLIQTSMDDIKEKEGDKGAIALPDEEEEMQTAERTRLALEALLDGKIAKAKPCTVQTSTEPEEPTYIRYTPNPEAPGFNPAAKQRVIRMVEAQVDPMEPPKHKHKKAPRGPPSPPVPVLHSPPRKLTVEDQQAWKIPPCISNWKNARGYTIPLDKRLAADGRGLQEVTINNKFATLSESLYIAERKASEDLRIRNQIRKKMSMREKEDKEAELREMANKARMERAGVLAAAVTGGRGADSFDEGDKYGASRSSQPRPSSPVDTYREKEILNYSPPSPPVRESGRERERERSDSRDRDRNHRDRDKMERRSDRYEDDYERSPDGETAEERVARVQREKLRIERRKERERELRLENMKGNMRKNKIDRDEGRDISEKIALGMHKGSGKLSGEAMYDSRLFNQSAGLDNGFGAEDEYSTYSKPLFDKGEASSIYRPKASDGDIYGDVDTQMAKLSDTSRFKADKGFKGAEGSSGSAGGRAEPVQFERGDSRRHDDDGRRSKRSRSDDD